MRLIISVPIVVLLSSNVMTDFVESDAHQVCAAGYDRLVGDPKQSRSVVLATNGIVATSQPLAAQAGLDILKSGGNAVDAAIATNAVLGVVEPMSCGIGGDLFVIYWDSKTEKLYGLNASGRSPFLLSREEFHRRELEEIPRYGPLSWSVPGCVDGWQQLRNRFGTMDMTEILAAAIATAESGFPVSETIAGNWAAAESRLQEWPDSSATFLIDGRRAPRFGEVFRNPRLAETYRTIAQDGARAFYQGDIAKQIVAFSEVHGGYFSTKDFVEHRSNWVDPVSTTYRGYKVWELPPNGQGIAVLEALNLLEHFDLQSMGIGSAELLHLVVEAKKLAFADRAKFYSDPEFNDLPTQQLISKEYARKQLARIRPNRAAKDFPAGDPKLVHGDTIYLTVVDRHRNCCSFIQSTFSSFGSQVVPGDVGFTLQNRGALFALENDHLNRFEPHKRPFHTIIPAMVTQNGKPYFCFGVMGGDMQPQGHVQVLVNLIDFGLNVQATGDAARVRHIGSAQPTGQPAAEGSGTVYVESGISDQTVDSLQEMGHNVVRNQTGFGGYQGILIDWENGVLHGATEARKDGAAVGY